MKTSLEQKIFKYYQKYYKDQLNLPDWEEHAKQRLNEEKIEAGKIKRLEKLLGSFSGKKILDLGCGTGGFLKVAKRKNAHVFGIDPQREAVEICLLKGIENVKVGRGENLSYPDDFFDFVFCYTVLEHVKDPKKTLLEMVRVTKKGGKIYIHTPNYLSFYEGHYKIFWLPLFPKFLAKIYLILRGRPTKFLDSINYLTPLKIINFFKKTPVEISFIKHQARLPRNFIEKLVFSYYKIFKIDPQIEAIIKKI